MIRSDTKRHKYEVPTEAYSSQRPTQSIRVVDLSYVGFHVVEWCLPR
jgi:hypothetical protein